MDQEIDLRDFFQLMWDRKSFICFSTILSGLSLLAFSFLLPNTYTSESILIPASKEESLSSKLGGYSALAGFAGVTLPSEVTSKSDEAIERIRSYDFFIKYFLPNIKKSHIMDLKGSKDVPSDQESFEIFSDALRVSSDKNTSFVNISISHRSPVIAKEWLDIIIYNINESMRTKDIVYAENSIKFLNETAKSTNVQSIKDAITILLEGQMQTLMLASSNQDYIFQILDPPIVPEKKSGPNRVIILLIGIILGALMGIFTVIIQQIKKSNST